MCPRTSSLVCLLLHLVSYIADPLVAPGDSIVLSLTPSISRSAFTDSNLPRGVEAPTKGKDKSFHEDLKETTHEKMLRERKTALNRLFDKTSLQPVALPEVKLGSSKGKGKAKDQSGTQSRRGMLEKYDGGAAMKKKGSSQGEEDEEGEEMSEMQLNMVCE